MKTPKIAIFLTDLGGGGAQKVMLNLADGFIDRDLAVDLVLVSKTGAYVSQINPRVNLIDLQGKSLSRSLPLLIRYLKQEQPSVLLSALEDTNIVAIFAKWLANTATKVTVTVHNTLSKEPIHTESLKRKFIFYLIPWLYLLADNVVAVSHGVAKDLIKLGLSKHKINAIYNPIVTPKLNVKLQQSLEHPWFSSDQPPVILGVGRFNIQKDFPTLIRAFAEIRKQISAKLIILGEGEEKSNFESLINKLGVTQDVLLPGFVQNPYVYMKQANIVVLSSAWEGFGNVLVEAMAAGTPVVSTDCPYGPAEILADGKYGKLVSVGDVNGMAKAIYQTLNEVPNTDKLTCRAFEFSQEKAVTKYIKLFF